MPQSITQDTKTSPFTQAETVTPVATESKAPTTALPLQPKPDGLRPRLGRWPVPGDVRLAATLSDRMAVYKAARAIHRSPAFVTDFINHGLLRAFRIGGTLDRPRLAVNLSELLAVIDRETVYVPPAMVGRRMPRPRVDKTALHPLAAAI